MKNRHAIVRAPDVAPGSPLEGPWIGRPLDRLEGRLKVCGQAPYSYELMGEREAAYGVIVTSTIARGRIVSISTGAAERAPGVLLVMTHRDAPPQPLADLSDANRYARAQPYLASDRVRFCGDPVAFVVAETFEQATAAAALVTVDYEPEDGRYDFARDHGEATPPPVVNAGLPTETRVGDFDTAFANAAVQFDVTYTTPVQNHAPMEPHASQARWKGDHLTLHLPSQIPMSARDCVALTLQIPKENVRIVCRYIGGGFGGKLPTLADALLSAIAARKLGRPVKAAMTRQQMFHSATTRTASVQRIRLGADRDGRLRAFSHDAAVHCPPHDDFAEQVVHGNRALYAAAARHTLHRLLRLDLPVTGAMRAPGEAIGMLTLESAMDELAVQLGLDPIDLRLRNEPEVHPESGKPFSTRQLVQCLQTGAQKFGWADRPATPGTRRDGRWLVGFGVAAMIRSNYMRPAKAEVRLSPQGRLMACQAMTDVGTGSFTILAQIAADAMGLRIDQVDVHIGDSDLAPTPGSGGSFGAASAGGALHATCLQLRDELLSLLTTHERSPWKGIAVAELSLQNGDVVHADQRRPLAEVLPELAPEGLRTKGGVTPGESYRTHSQQCYGATFCEVGVDPDTGEVRVRRLLGVFEIGRVLNPKTARSQALGGMIWGVGGALMEGNEVDLRHGAFVQRDLANYHVPAHADIPDIDVEFLPEHDPLANALGAKGVGELGICGSGAAVANAVYNACGVRVRDFPITVEKVLAGLAAGEPVRAG